MTRKSSLEDLFQISEEQQIEIELRDFTTELDRIIAEYEFTIAALNLSKPLCSRISEILQEHFDRLDKEEKNK